MTAFFSEDRCLNKESHDVLGHCTVTDATVKADKVERLRLC